MMYAVIEADGFFRDYATVIKVYTERSKAIKLTSHDRRWQAISGAAFELGEKIHRSSLGSIYPRIADDLPQS